ncbi:hypothetical protein UFOVP1324_6 [uncultured Caudovirales phage]|uniref:Uncharacterized protein n=1 Tax=uncultured Caudovirales phage TaxID=2100421 RepID=A0A6J5RNW1_9CAUD|nr:hypothetical protein UFOVP1324_6 [uncultured Caudovirales phage]
MAASDVDIVNMALGHIGDRANVSAISPSDGSAQADAAARVYAHIRDWLLERFPWKFALRRSTLAERSDITMGSWDHIYAEPNNCLRVIGILPSGYSSDDSVVDFDTETDETGQGLILTDAEDATARYVARITDPGKFTPGFTETFSWFLAASLAGPIVKGETGRTEALRCIQMASLAFASAAGLSANQAKRRLDHIPDFIAARGVVLDDENAKIIRS